ncbi:MAG: IS256 family transposase [Methanosarcinaceae archaeon]|nr:IS256 family transposase [Methanosarcinaceae archaeon]
MAKSKEPLEKLLDEIDFKNLSPEEITGPDGLLKQLSKRMIEKAMEAEIEDHLGYEKNQRSQENSSNYRNGKSKKIVSTEIGDIPIDIPRDRKSEFEPKIIPKHQRRFDGFNNKIISMYGLGMTTRDIKKHLFEIYNVEVSPELISNVTDAIMDDVREWRNRPVDNIYPIVFFDALVVKGRTDGRVVNKSVYTAIGINMEGEKEVLGLWIADTEGAKFWMSIITELKNRGLNDILIACIDGLKGFPEAIISVYPQTRIQLCIVHMIRNSTRFVSWKERRSLCADLKRIYTAISEAEGLNALEDFSDKWDSKYPMISKSWRNNWDNLNEFFNYPDYIRKAIYTTNAIESLNSSLKKVTKKRSAFPTDDAIYKVLYLALTSSSKRWTMPIRDWGAAINQFAIHFEDRVPI